MNGTNDKNARRLVRRLIKKFCAPEKKQPSVKPVDNANSGDTGDARRIKI
jgi:hypothetical protein